MKKLRKLLIISMLSYPIARVLVRLLWCVGRLLELGLGLVFGEYIGVFPNFFGSAATYSLVISINVCVLIKALDYIFRPQPPAGAETEGGEQ